MAKRRGRRDTPDDVRLSVEGYKAVRQRQEIRVAPLTIIAGVNSSGKSSFMQPFLLMKQTLDSAFDPGPLLLYGANVKITEYLQMFSRGKAKNDAVDQFSVGLGSGETFRTITFKARFGGPLRIVRDATRSGQSHQELTNPLTGAQKSRMKEAAAQYAKQYEEFFRSGVLGQQGSSREELEFSWEPGVVRNRCFLEAMIKFNFGESEHRFPYPVSNADDERWIDFIRGIIHVPGLRGNPERAYQRTAVGDTYPGTFDTYVANIIFEWSDRDPDRLAGLAADLELLGLTWKVMARRVNDASIELMVGRMPHAQQGGAFDLVSVADVGFGVSQTLPVLVALHAAVAGQVVYIEQPEIHLHPRAQLALASVLVAAAARGVHVIAETHSSLLIRGIQTAVADGSINPHDLSLNWFGRNETDGSQVITVAELDEAGRFGDWPLDFDEISREADWNYLDAVEDQE